MDYSKDYTDLCDKKAYTHQAFYTGTDCRSPEGKWKILLYSKGSYWVSSVHHTKYRKDGGFPDEQYPKYRLLLDTISLIE